MQRIAGILAGISYDLVCGRPFEILVPHGWQESFLDEGFILDKKIGVGQPKRMENAKILVANTAMDTDKIKIYGARVRVDSMQKVADIEKAERDKMRSKVGPDHPVSPQLRIDEGDSVQQAWGSKA